MVTRTWKHISPGILSQAADWFVNFRTADVMSSARRKFPRGLRLSPQHVKTHLVVARTYADPASANMPLPPKVTEQLARVRRQAAADAVPLRNGL